ncbi:MAG: recombinase family protein [Prevotellaceae bacterium]|jgi:DNA invertase Pin-like site-specific DNA recombinase|nr:recombinase family protein [Prevotellaceae bacterium]
MPDVECAANISGCRKEAEMNKQKITILYERLSRDDGEDGLSNSIKNQTTLLEEYAKRNGFTPYISVSDDGFSGTNFNRPGWQELIARIENGEVSTIICKDSSRMARNYLQAGLYREMFREKGVRLICVNDGTDTANGEDDFTPFREIMSEWYARDTSKKIRAIFNSRMAAGYHCTGSIPYGYMHDPDDRQKWIVDETAAKVVQRIFQLIIEGNGVYQIANILEHEKVLIPTAHWENLGVAENVRHSYKNPYLWRGGVVSSIIERREYMGHVVLHKTYSDSYKSKKRKNSPKEEMLVFEGAIPQIIDEETWNNAQRLRKTVRRPAKNGDPPYRLTGVLYCADCGSKMSHERSADNRPNRSPKNEYVCSNYRQRTRVCSIHFIRVPVIEELILSTIKRVSAYVRENETEFVKRVREVSNLQQEESIKDSKKQLNKSKRRRDELDGLIKKLYESYALEKIPEKHFEKLIAEYDSEQTALDASITKLQTEIDTFDSDSVRADKFIELVKKYTEFDELSTVMLNNFIEKVIVHEADKSSGKRIQKIDVYLNFIGNFDVPIPELTP